MPSYLFVPLATYKISLDVSIYQVAICNEIIDDYGVAAELNAIFAAVEAINCNKGHVVINEVDKEKDQRSTRSL